MSSLSPRLAQWTLVPTRSIQSQAPTLPTAVVAFTESIIIIDNLIASLYCRFGIFTLSLVFSILFKQYLQWLVSSGGHKENSRLQGRAMTSFPTVYWHHHRLDGISRSCPFDNSPLPPYRSTTLDHRQHSSSIRGMFGSIEVSGKLPTYPSPNPTFGPMWEVSVNVDLGEG